ncbi:hypothetical protein FSP39_013527 [Pinctada imbricata]|uniref:Methylcytosine dioxygenase TET n=1 Tax=Pinctada imbricata TaxID=66713 RepID=A0AA88XYV9_PINIB|nr:hypothetical protein FSP39_013527 [Pinctada imbricata]
MDSGGSDLRGDNWWHSETDQSNSALQARSWTGHSGTDRSNTALQDRSWAGHVKQGHWQGEGQVSDLFGLLPEYRDDRSFYVPNDEQKLSPNPPPPSSPKFPSPAVLRRRLERMHGNPVNGRLDMPSFDKAMDFSLNNIDHSFPPFGQPSRNHSTADVSVRTQDFITQPRNGINEHLFSTQDLSENLFGLTSRRQIQEDISLDTKTQYFPKTSEHLNGFSEQNLNSLEKSSNIFSKQSLGLPFRLKNGQKDAHIPLSNNKISMPSPLNGLSKIPENTQLPQVPFSEEFSHQKPRESSEIVASNIKIHDISRQHLDFQIPLKNPIDHNRTFESIPDRNCTDKMSFRNFEQAFHSNSSALLSNVCALPVREQNSVKGKLKFKINGKLSAPSVSEGVHDIACHPSITSTTPSVMASESRVDNSSNDRVGNSTCVPQVTTHNVKLSTDSLTNLEHTQFLDPGKRSPSDIESKSPKLHKVNGMNSCKTKKSTTKLKNKVNNLEIQSTVQQILNKITSEMKKKEKGKIVKTGQSPDCCTTCENLGFRDSPKCLNKRSDNGLDVFEFNDEEDNKFQLPTFTSRLNSNISNTTTSNVSSRLSSSVPAQCSVVTSNSSPKLLTSFSTNHNAKLDSKTFIKQNAEGPVMLPSSTTSYLPSPNSHLQASPPIPNTEAEKENLCKSSNQKAATTPLFKTDFNSKNVKEDLIKDAEDPLQGGLERIAWIKEHVSKLNDENAEEDEHTERLRKNIKVEIPQCDCRGPGYVPSEEVEGPYYTQLGTAKSIKAIRELVEQRTGCTGKALRIEKIRYTSKEGKSSQGCPIAKWIIRRSSEDEKYLCVVRQRPGHCCDTACIVVVLVAWEGVPGDTADELYDYLVKLLPKNGLETERRCGTNEKKTCACQGVDLMRRGASFSFGCSWSMYYNGCKFARSRDARKFKLKESSKEEELEENLQHLASLMGPLYKEMAPDAYNNQTKFERTAEMCRLGKQEGRPFSGVTACVDFCAHAHKDVHNMQNGSTVVVTLTKHRGLEKPEDEQLHVLPLHVMDMTDEHGDMDAQFDKIRTGALEVLQKYPMEARMRAVPLTPNRKKKGKKNILAPGKKGRRPKKPPQPTLDTPPSHKSSLLSEEDKTLENLYYSKELAARETGQIEGSKKLNFEESKAFSTFEDLMQYSHLPGFSIMYESFHRYKNEHGACPPPEFFELCKSLFIEPSNGFTKCDQDSAIGYSTQMASENTVISNNLSTMTTQGIKDGAGIQGQGHLWQADLDPVQLPIDLSSSGSKNDLKTTFSCSNNRAANIDQTNHLSSLDLLLDVTAKTTLPHTSSASYDSFSSSLEGSTNSNIEHSIHLQNMQRKLDIDVSKGVCPSDLQDLITARNNASDDSPLYDPTVVKCEMQYNEDAFHDPEIGGVAIALQHGAVLFEVAKRELHATTGLRYPNRYAPTRISLVFYQHKNLNYFHHGWHEYVRKCEILRKRRQDAANNSDLTQEEPKKKKHKKDVDITKTSAAKYKYMWEAPVVHGNTFTTDSVITRFIDPQPMVTGPYQRWV